jgi:hypothetical protein
MAYIGASPAPLATAVDSNAVETGDIQNSAVTTAKIADAAVTNAKIDTVAASKLTGALPAIDGSALTGITVPTAVSQLTNDSGYLTSSTGVTTVNGSSGAVTVQPTLVSGTNIKTINSTSLLGSGNISISSGLQLDTNTSSTATNYAVGQYLFLACGNVPGINQTMNSIYHGTGGYANTLIVSACGGTTGSALSGTWRNRGSGDGSYNHTLAQRTA